MKDPRVEAIEELRRMGTPEEKAPAEEKTVPADLTTDSLPFSPYLVERKALGTDPIFCVMPEDKKIRLTDRVSDEELVAITELFVASAPYRQLANDHKGKVRSLLYHFGEKMTFQPNAQSFDDVVLRQIAKGNLSIQLRKKWGLLSSIRSSLRESFLYAQSNFGEETQSNRIVELSYTYGDLLVLEEELRLVYWALEDCYKIHVAFQEVFEAMPESEVVCCHKTVISQGLRPSELLKKTVISLTDAQRGLPSPFARSSRFKQPELLSRDERAAAANKYKGTIWENSVGSGKDVELTHAEKQFDSRVAYLQNGPPLFEVLQFIKKVSAIRPFEYKWPEVLEVPERPQPLATWKYPSVKEQNNAP